MTTPRDPRTVAAEPTMCAREGCGKREADHIRGWGGAAYCWWRGWDLSLRHLDPHWEMGRRSDDAFVPAASLPIPEPDGQ